MAAKAPALRKKKIEVVYQADDGQVGTRAVAAEAAGVWALHKEIAVPEGRTERWWTVTHVPTGRVFLHVHTQPVARALTRRLARMDVLQVPQGALVGRQAERVARAFAGTLGGSGVTELRSWVMAEIGSPKPAPNLPARIASWQPGTPTSWSLAGARSRPKKAAKPAPRGKGITLSDLIRLAYEGNP